MAPRARVNEGRSDESGPSRPFTLKEVQKHNSADDCWLVIRNKVYDVTKFVPNHPGGELITLQPGQDVTAMFESLHPLATRSILPKYQVGLLAEDDHGKVLHYNDEDKFYVTLKQRVEAYFTKNNLTPRDVPAMYLKSFIIMAVCTLSYFYTLLSLEMSPIARFLTATLWGVSMAWVGVSIQHDANHGGYSSSPLVCEIFGATLDFLTGASSFMWQQQHDFGHHSYTNVDVADPDVRVKDPDVRRVTSTQPWRPWHRFQHLYLGVLYGALALKSVYSDDFTALKEKRIGSVTFGSMNNRQKFVFWGGKAVYYFGVLVLPRIFGLPILAHAAAYIWAMLCTGWYLAFMFQVAHVVQEVEWPGVDSRKQVKGDWAELQVRTTANFCSGSKMWNWLSGGLSNQIEHHLFPSICHIHYTNLAPIVKQTCKEFDIPYYDFATFPQALKSHFAYLHSVGIENVHVRLGD